MAVELLQLTRSVHSMVEEQYVQMRFARSQPDPGLGGLLHSPLIESSQHKLDGVLDEVRALKQASEAVIRLVNETMKVRAKANAQEQKK